MQMNERRFRADDAPVIPDVRSQFAVISVLLTAAFLYASTVPLVFGVPDYRARLVASVQPAFSESGRAFDSIVNVLALMPLGFFWSGLSAGHAATGSSDRRTFCRVALGCLAIATLAESLQIWLPRRVPSVRDLVALEIGAILGCSLWRYFGERAIIFCCSISRRLTSRRSTAGRHGRPRCVNWLGLFACLLAFCLAVNTWASPLEYFEMYRQRAFLKAGVGAPGEFFRPGSTSLGSALVSSTATALVLVGLCSLSVHRLERTGPRSTNGLRIFVAEEMTSANDASLAQCDASHERTDTELPLERAA